MERKKLCCPKPKRSGKRPKSKDEELATLTKALGHPIRLKIIRILLKKQVCICGEIVEELPLAQSTVSQHLRVLKEAGLILGEIKGSKTCYCIEPKAVERFKELAATL